MRQRLRPRGLRARLTVAFIVVTLLGAVAAAWATSRSASDSLVGESQRQFTESTVAQVDAFAPQLGYPPDQASLDRLRVALGPNALVTYRGLSSAHGAARLVSRRLREAVAGERGTVVERVTAAGTPWLVVGAPIAITRLDGGRARSGVSVFVLRDLSDVQAAVRSGVGRAALVTAVVALPLAVVLALVAAGSVLRPVRELRDTARRLAHGDLEARSPSRGADELADLGETVNEMAAELQGSMAAMERMQADARRFAADVSHELRTPLSTLTAVVEVLDEESRAMGGDARESARLAIAETGRLVALVEDLMEVSRFDAGTARLRPERVDLGEAVRATLRARGWLDRVSLDARPGILVTLDRRRLDVIVANLVANALGHGRPPVRVLVSASAQQVSVTVTDGGAGLPADVSQRVFERFYKADAARGRVSGSGLGLAIALENARLHGGGIAVGDAPGGGAAFELHLPRESESGPEPSP